MAFCLRRSVQHSRLGVHHYRTLGREFGGSDVSRLLHRLFARDRYRPRTRRTVRRASDLRARLLLDALEGRIAPATFNVTNANDLGAGSLRQAILDANGATGADIISFDATFFSTSRMITLAGQLNVTDSVTINGPGAANLTVSGNNASRVFNISNGAATVLNVTVAGLRITGGRVTGEDGGGVFIDNENVTILDSVIIANTVVAATFTSGGGIGVSNKGQLTVRNSTVSGNSCTGRGGGIYFYADGSLVLENSTISGNSSGQGGGGGIYFLGTVEGPGFLIRNTTISGNTAAGGGSGGGVFLKDFLGIAVIQNSTIANNSATSTETAAGT